MLDISDIKSIMYTEKSLNQKENSIIVIQTSCSMNKNALKHIFVEYFGFVPTRINSLKQRGKIKRFRGIKGRRANYKKFYVKVPEGATLDVFKA